MNEREKGYLYMQNESDYKNVQKQVCLTNEQKNKQTNETI